VRRGLLAGGLVFAALVAAGAVSGHRAIAMPADAGKYRVLLPRSVDGSPLDATSEDAVQLRSSVWGSGDLGRFPGAVPVTALYDQQGQSWLYVWGAYGKLADPSGELSAFWNNFDALPFGLSGGPTWRRRPDRAAATCSARTTRRRAPGRTTAASSWSACHLPAISPG
jgi:hypothetical protein